MANGFWLRQHGVDTHGATGAAVETLLIQNGLGVDISETRKLTLMGYYMTLFSPTSVLYAARLIVNPEMIDAADLDISNPDDADDMVWAKHYAHAGTPAYFQIRSKRSLGPEDEVHMQTFALSVADDIAWSFQSYVVAH